jgi:Universal stress protein family
MTIAVGYDKRPAARDALILGELLARTTNRGLVVRVEPGLCQEGVDLLVMGSRGHGPLGSVLLGSTATDVIAAAPSPVVVVPRPAAAGRAA